MIGSYPFPSKCPNCGKPAYHFVGPSFGEPGFYLCDPEPPCEEAATHQEFHDS